MSKAFHSPLNYWIAALALLVFSMIVIGGLTRLSESGLSIVEWKLVSGILPPMSEESWDKEFAAYQTSPQYQKVNKGMTVGDFKQIFWLEYLHRLLGRLIGLMAMVPLFFISLRRGVAPDWLLPRMWLVALLVGTQGTVGWYMVKSGLIDMPWVSPYRLALHLGLALSLLGLLAVTLLRLNQVRNHVTAVPFWLSRLALGVSGLIFMQILLGAFVAGLDAGLSYNTFPKMDGDLVPQGLWQLEPAWRNIFENVTTVNFLHRWWAFVVATGVLVQSFFLLQQPSSAALKTMFLLPAGLVVVQIGLGISTLLHVVPITLAVTHQAVAALLFTANVVVAYLVYRKKVPSPALQPVNMS